MIGENADGNGASKRFASQLYRHNRDRFAEIAPEQGLFATAPLVAWKIVLRNQYPG